MMQRNIVILSIFLLVGCTTVGPIDQPQFMPLVEKASGVPSSNIAISGRVSWAPTNTDSCWFATLVQLYLALPIVNCTSEQIQNSRQFFALYRYDIRELPPAKEGVLIVTDTELTFLDWHEKDKLYAKASTFPIGNISTLEIYRFGLTRLVRLTVTNSDYKYYVITLMGAQGQQQDHVKSDLLFDHIKNRLAKDIKVITY